jgi:hypothetical protein
VNTRRLATIYSDVKDDLLLFLDLYRRIKKEKLNKQQIIELLKLPNRLLDLKKKKNIYNDNIWEMHSKKLQLEKEIEEKRKRLLTL